MNLHVFTTVCTSIQYLQLHHQVFACLQNELVFTDIITLSLNGAVSEEPEGAKQPRTGKASLAWRVTLCMYVRTYAYISQTAITQAKYCTLCII